MDDTLSEESLLRYSRHILLDQIGEKGQLNLKNSTVLLVGVGGLGAPAAMYLAASGVGTLILADDDQVDLTNLQRQIIYDMEDIGMDKALSAKKRLGAMNPQCQVVSLSQRLAGKNLDEVIAKSDVVLDCSDNFITRHNINRACVAHKIPLVMGAAVRFDGQLSAFDARQVSSPCYYCLFPEDQPVPETRCALLGIFAPVTGIIGSMQAAEALKILIPCGKTLVGRLLLFNALTMEWNSILVPKNPLCPVCGPTSSRR